MSGMQRLVERVFRLDIEHRGAGGGTLRVIACIDQGTFDEATGATTSGPREDITGTVPGRARGRSRARPRVGGGERGRSEAASPRAATHAGERRGTGGYPKRDRRQGTNASASLPATISPVASRPTTGPSPPPRA